MDMQPISAAPEQTRVVSLVDARTRYRAERCRHMQIAVDEELSTVECTDCGEKLNPISVLLRFTHEETRWSRQAAELRKLHSELDARIRCKCQHCGQMTRIRT